VTAIATARRPAANGVTLLFLAGLSIVMAPAGWRLYETVSDARYLARQYIISQADRLLEEIKLRDHGIDSIDDDLVGPYGGAHSAAYGFRILDEDASTLAQFNGAGIGEASPAVGGSPRPPDFWWRKLGEGRFDIAGGVRHKLGDQDVWVEVMTHGDPDGYRFRMIVADVVADVSKHLVVALALTAAVLALGARAGRRAFVTIGDGGPAGVLRAPVIAWRRGRAGPVAGRLHGRAGKPESSAPDERVARVSHDMRSRLAVVLLELNRIPDARARVLESEVAEMGRSLTSLMSATGPEGSGSAAELEAVDLAEVAASVVERLEPLAEARRCEVSLTVDRPSPLVGDREQIAEAIRNVVENAIKHGPDGNRVVVTCGRGPVVAIDDAGPGLAVEDPARLFEPYERGATQSDGSGLGLAVVKAVIDLHRGSIEVGRSSLGGSRFILSFESIRAGWTRAAHTEAAENASSPSPID
jgi:signal transduction histidine kinase